MFENTTITIHLAPLVAVFLIARTIAVAGLITMGMSLLLFSRVTEDTVTKEVNWDWSSIITGFIFLVCAFLVYGYPLY